MSATIELTQSFTPEERQKYIGASELGAVLGIDKYRTPLDVYNEKLGLSVPFEGNRHTERGNRMEKIAAELYTEMTGKKLRRHSEAYIHHKHPYIVGHVDRTVVGMRRIAEIKCPSLGAYRRIQREGLPDSMIVQLQSYLGLSGIREGEWIIFCADQMDILNFTIEFDPAIYQAAIDAAVDLWENHIIPKIPPTPDAADKPALEFAKIGGDIIKRDDPQWAEAAQLLREADQLKKDGEELYELAKEKVKDAIEGEHGRYEGAGLRLYYTQQAGRTSFDKKTLAKEHPEIKLTRYEKQGAAFDVFKPYFIGE